MVDLDALRKRFKEENDAKRTSPRQNTSYNNSLEDSSFSKGADYHYHLAICYDYGLDGYEVDEEKAMSEYLVAAELGHSSAMTEISSDYSDAEDSILGYDLVLSEKWARKADLN